MSGENAGDIAMIVEVSYLYQPCSLADNNLLPWQSTSIANVEPLMFGFDMVIVGAISALLRFL